VDIRNEHAMAMDDSGKSAAAACGDSLHAGAMRLDRRPRAKQPMPSCLLAPGWLLAAG
jgi:hypothetical protein